MEVLIRKNADHHGRARLRGAPCRLASYLGAYVEEDAWAWAPSCLVLGGAVLVLLVHDLVDRGPTRDHIVADLDESEEERIMEDCLVISHHLAVDSCPNLRAAHACRRHEAKGLSWHRACGSC